MGSSPSLTISNEITKNPIFHRFWQEQHNDTIQQLTEKHSKQVAKLEEALQKAAEVVVVKDSEPRTDKDDKREITPDVYEAMKADINRLEVRKMFNFSDCYRSSLVFILVPEWIMEFSEVKRTST